MGKKNLEQLFEETFTKFHEVPDEKVWNSIEASLDKKKKKRVIPIWWQMGGVAALLALLFYVINPFEDTANNVPIIVTETENRDTPFQNDSTIKKEPEGQKLTETSTNDNLDLLEDNDERNAQRDADGSINRNQSINPDKQIVTTTTSEKKEALEKKDFRFNVINKSNQNIASIDSVSNKKSETEHKKSDVLGVSKKKETIAIASSDRKDKKEASSADEVANNLFKQEKNLENSKENETIAQNNEENNKSEKQSIFDAIKEQEEDVVVENTASDKWSLGPSVAPVYFNATGDGSPIHSNFASNSKSGNVNLSYGLTVAYNLNKRLKVRSGVHKVNYGYDTNEIVFSSSLDASTNALIDNINYSQTSRNLVVQSKNSLPQAFANDASLELVASESPALDGKMVQQLGYIEVPLELNYALIDKKFGVDLIGGVSSLFLVDNSVLLESEDLVTEVGEANNANSVNFSTNVGIGLNYEFSPKVQLNLEPVFKYQLNTFSETAGEFRPFSVGVYSGISFKF